MQFFDFAFENVINGTGFCPVKLDIYQDGREYDALVKVVEFSSPQMGMFNTLNVNKLPDGTIWLDFLSKKYAPNATLMQFMKYCTDKWGLDSKQQGYPTQNDTTLLREGRFGRYWQNVKIIQCKLDNHISLTIILRIIIDNQEMSNFTKQLAKGFISSAVNQVGRDGGRVISNNIYNGGNYVPVAEVSDNDASTPPIAPTQSGIPQDAISSTKHFTAGKMVWLSILSLFLMPLGSLFVLLYGVFMIMDRSDKVTWYTSEPNYVRDRRYKTGVRYVGNISKQHTAKVPASTDVMNIKKRNATIAIIIGAVGIVLFTIIMVLANNQ